MSNIVVPANKKLVVENYIKDGGLEMLVVDTTNTIDNSAITATKSTAGAMIRRSTALFGSALAITENNVKVNHSTSPTYTEDNEMVLLHCSFRPKVASTSERLTHVVEMHPPKVLVSSSNITTTAMVSGTTSVFSQMSVSETHTETSHKDRVVSILWANPTSSMLSHNKYLVYSYRIE